jgi:flavin-dependent dehydrogenase
VPLVAERSQAHPVRLGVEPETWDALVVGGGPAGAAAATLLSRLGHRVVLFEKALFPRFHIGESLLPFSIPLMEKLGFAERLQAAGFTPKWGATFVLADGRQEHEFCFADGLVSGAPMSYQVLRSRFDELLVEHSRACGADVRQGHVVTDVNATQADPVVQVRTAQGRTYGARGRFLIDATGRNALLAHKWALMRPEDSLRKVALFAHYRGATRDVGRAAGNTVSVVIRNGWMWFIPLEADLASIGVVVDDDAFRQSGLTGEDYFEDVLARVPVVAKRLTSAVRVSPVHVTSDFSYTTSRISGKNWLLTGDAGFFLDPIFSSGVHLAVASGIAAAEAIDDRLVSRRRWVAPFTRYRWKTRRDQALYRAFIAGWYRPGFQELLLAPATRLKLVPAVTSALAGAPRTWPLAWRLQLFMLLARINEVVALVPRLDRSTLPP